MVIIFIGCRTEELPKTPPMPAVPGDVGHGETGDLLWDQQDYRGPEEMGLAAGHPGSLLWPSAAPPSTQPHVLLEEEASLGEKINKKV